MSLVIIASPEHLADVPIDERRLFTCKNL